MENNQKSIEELRIGLIRLQNDYGKTKKEMAEIVKISPSAYGRILNGQTKTAKTHILSAAAKYFGKTTDAIMGGKFEYSDTLIINLFRELSETGKKRAILYLTEIRDKEKSKK